VREEFGELPGGEAKLMWGLAGVEVQRGGGSAAEQEMLRSGASGRRFRVWGGNYEVGDKGAEGAGWFKEGSQGSRGGALGERPAKIAAGVAWPVEGGGRRGRQVGPDYQRERAAGMTEKRRKAAGILAEPPELFQLKCANDRYAAGINSTHFKRNNPLVCRVSARFNHGSTGSKQVYLARRRVYNHRTAHQLLIYKNANLITN
jgi:hypothetical protein